MTRNGVDKGFGLGVRRVNRARANWHDDGEPKWLSSTQGIVLLVEVEKVEEKSR